MPTYLDRYLAGEHEQVWDELLALGAAVREQPLYADALAVARETMRRARFNVETIVGKLRKNGYIFESYRPYRKATSVDIARITELEIRVGLLPLSVRAWYELVSAVDLGGSHPDWPRHNWYVPEQMWNSLLEKEEVGMRGKFTNLISTPLKMLESSVLNVTDFYFDEYGEMNNDGGSRIGLIIDSANGEAWRINGGAVPDIIAPDLSTDGRFRYPDWHLAPTFVGYLRKCFRWGGFPGFANVDESLRPTAMLAELTDGLLPI